MVKCCVNFNNVLIFYKLYIKIFFLNYPIYNNITSIFNYLYVIQIREKQKKNNIIQVEKNNRDNINQEKQKFKVIINVNGMKLQIYP